MAARGVRVVLTADTSLIEAALLKAREHSWEFGLLLLIRRAGIPCTVADVLRAVAENA